MSQKIQTKLTIDINFIILDVKRNEKKTTVDSNLDGRKKVVRIAENSNKRG